MPLGSPRLAHLKFVMTPVLLVVNVFPPCRGDFPHPSLALFTIQNRIFNILEIYQIKEQMIGSGKFMKTYKGARTIDGIKVTVDGEPLDERADIQRFSTTGFEWTYSGDEPRQLALALLANYLGDDIRALELSEGFMNAVVSDLDNDWQLTGNEIAAALEALG